METLYIFGFIKYPVDARCEFMEAGETIATLLFGIHAHTYAHSNFRFFEQ